MKSRLANWEIAVYALHLLGGEARRIGTEDIALKCFELAPDSFSWVKYPEYPDKDVARTGLVDARKPKNGVLVQGRAGRGRGHSSQTNADPALDGWMLTEEGVKWAMSNKERLADDLKYRESSTHRQETLQRIARIRRHRLFLQFLEQPEGFSPSLGDMAELFRCRVDADAHTWQKRFQTAANLAQSVAEMQVLAFIDKCRASVGSQVNQP